MGSGSAVGRRPVLQGGLAALLAASSRVPGRAESDRERYLLGRGIGDVTGQPAENGMMGYARLAQRTTGIHQRQRARAFVIAEHDAPERRVTVVTVDTGMIFGAVRRAVLERLARRHGNRYGEHNVLLTATHTHAGPGGFSCHTLYNVTTLGFQPATFEALVAGITESIERAEADLAPGDLRVGHGELTDASVNRSRAAFDRNPAADKRHFPRAVDPTTVLLSFERGGRPVGVINWFATHGTSLSPDNTLISGDNKGYAAYRWEREVAGADYRAGDPGFVAAFAQSNAADMSPNLELRPGTGPTEDEFANTRIIGDRQYTAAARLLTGANRAVRGGIDCRISYVDMSNTTVTPGFTGDGSPHRTCAAALGASFAAGAEDGPGPSIFEEGAGNNPFFGTISGALYQASPRLRERQAPKEILLPVGAMGWVPRILPIQLVRLGTLYLLGIPQEVSIVGGLRLRRTVAAELGAAPTDVVVAGYANDYAGYLTTPEEYDQQAYEGGHTMFGRWSLPAYQQESARIAADMASGEETARGPSPAGNPRGGRVRLQPGVVFDSPPLGREFGEVLEQPEGHYRRGGTARVVFASAHPNNDLHRDGSYLLVQRRSADGWVTVADDGDWSTAYHWARRGVAASTATVTWTIPAEAAGGEYRIVHHGDAKAVGGEITPFSGTSRTFRVG
ncbi:alkaline ceramidase [Actinopolyspora erythraea]|uniref:Neutral ceramidase n=1 Tax=Actinopolyspora erythraea TaxID=414996 RepID=A0A099D3U5_9ACTN|nr:neutral/alkaline ceramidase [Actinopolyspora erythraea]ASU77532.1 alkaline ceramidase [Actinopolyspora erythraea]KGI80472.1 neutral/alkaline nonlysosomal ceramidase [Actinopolyspora erythraea]